MKYNKEMLLVEQKLAKKKMEEIEAKAMAMVEMTEQLYSDIERAELNLSVINYALEEIEHTNSKEVVCYILPIK
jgi:hypothetical protein